MTLKLLDKIRILRTFIFSSLKHFNLVSEPQFCVRVLRPKDRETTCSEKFPNFAFQILDNYHL